jgi:hypothetical protein
MNESEEQALECIRFGARQTARARKRGDEIGESFLMELGLKALSCVPAALAYDAKVAFKEAFDAELGAPDES